MSTDTQTLSPGMQKHAIAEYADEHGLQVVATYEDDAKSGLTLRQRKEMRRLLGDVTSDECPYSLVLVYDVSRWGRFQDTDESAYYEYHCRMHGVDVVYVQEGFEQHLTPMAALLKAAKRAMAAEFSRELAIKVDQGQRRAIAMGFHIGRTPSIGVARMGVSADGSSRSLAHLERHRKDEHVVWVPGPPEEVALVKRIFREYTRTEATLAGLARTLNDEGHSAHGKPFTLTMVRTIIDCEIFRGYFVWGLKKSAPLSQKRGANDPAVVRVPVQFEAAVSEGTWNKAQAKRKFRYHKFGRTKQQLLEELRAALGKRPDLTATDLLGNQCSTIGVYRKAFGSFREAMRRAGRDESAMFQQYLRRASRTHMLSKRFKWDLVNLLESEGLGPEARGNNQLVRIASTITLRYKLIWKREHRRGLRWNFLRTSFGCDYVLLVLMEENDTANDLLLMSANEYKQLRQWFDLSSIAPATRIRSSEQLVSRLLDLTCANQRSTEYRC